MSESKINVSILDKLFPFFFVTDKNGQLVHLGPSLKKLINEPLNYVYFKDYFMVSRPANTSYEEIIKTEDGEMITLKMLQPEANFIGQIINLPDTKNHIFIINLVVQEAEELTSLQLNFNDFAIQDPIFDYLMLLQTQRRAIRQANELNEKMVEARNTAIRASEVKSLFLANMSHELRTPMNGLLGMASILLGTKLDDEQREYVDTLITCAESMLSLINDILDLSKIEAGHINLEETSIDLNELITLIFQTTYPLAKKKNLDLRMSIDTNVPHLIYADFNRLRQILLNIVGNAIKFTKTGFVKMKLTASDTSLDDFLLTIKIEDSGIGMSHETLAKIFSPFVQGDNSMTKKFEGTGLGLSICKRLAEAMNGKITVESSESKGSIFTLQIPFNIPAQNTPRKKQFSLAS